jgi:hypothetical protein
MNSTFGFTHTVGNITLDCEGEYVAWGNHWPEEAEITDILHKGVSVIEILDQVYIDLIQSEAYSEAYEAWESDRADAQDSRRAA